MSVILRKANIQDLPALTAIYNHYVTNSIATFDIKPLAIEQRTRWFSQFNDNRHQCWVACAPLKQSERCIGYACSLPFKVKEAYQFSVETSVYLDPEYSGKGIGADLYSALFSELSQTDIHRAYAGITIPNDASLALHKKYGFQQIGHLREVGNKFDKYWDVIWMEKNL